MSAAPMFDVAEKMILAPSGLDENRLSSVLGTVMSRGVDYADLYFQLSREESWSLEDGIVKEGSHSIEQGVGVRAISGEKTGFTPKFGTIPLPKGILEAVPTAGAARFASTLSPRHFRRRMAEVRIGAAVERLARAGAPIARAEGFEVHAESMEARVRENETS